MGQFSFKSFQKNNKMGAKPFIYEMNPTSCLFGRSSGP